MPYSHKLPARFDAWQIKIYDKEGPEDPHVSVIRKGDTWRIRLRDFSYMDDTPPSRDVPKEIEKIIKDDVGKLSEEWDKLHGSYNPVKGKEDETADTDAERSKGKRPQKGDSKKPRWRKLFRR